MENRISWTTYQGFRILIADFSGIQDETEYLATFDAVERAIIHQPKNSVMGMIVDITNSKMTQSISSRGRKMVDNIHAAGIADYPSAIVGGTNLQKTVVSAIAIFRHDVFTADTREAALVQLAKYLKSSETGK